MSAAANLPEAVLVNGEPQAQLSVLERGLHYGDGLFETIACLAGCARLLPRHLQRLARGCERLGLPVPQPSRVQADIERLAAGHERSIIKLLLLRGEAQARGYALSGGEQATRIALRYAWPAPPPQLAEEGVRVRIAQLRLGENPHLAGIKHCNRLEQVLARREWSDPDIAEALLFSSSEELVCGTMSNVFLVRAGQLLTPALELCGVAGVMRASVLEAAQGAGMAGVTGRLQAQDLQAAEEIFLTNALIGIRPVRELAGRALPVGPVTRTLQRALALRLQAQVPTQRLPV